MFGLAALLVIASPVSADLKFKAVEITGGGHFILVSGDFGPDDDLTPFLQLVTRHSPKFVAFDSEGGNPSKAMQLGRMIRALQIETRQTRPLNCDSACALAFIGGSKRLALPGSIGVHMARIRKDGTRDADLEGARLQYLTALMLAYVREMGVSSELIELALQYSADDMRHLSTSEMLKLGVITGGNSSAEFTPPSSLNPRQPPPQPRNQPVSPNSADINDCDRLAANPYDQRKHRLASGVDYNALLGNRKDAATQCEQAVSQFPNELRFQYQLARAIELDDPKRAAAMYSNLINARYLAAYDNLGWMYNTGRFGGRVNKTAALKLFREGAELGDPDSMHSFGVSLWEENPKQAVDWFQRATKLGHVEAKKNLERLETEMKQAEQPEVFPLFRMFKQK